MSVPKRWGDEFDDSDDEQAQKPTLSADTPIPPTHYSRIDKQGIQVVTSYRPGRLPGQLLKTVTKQRVEVVKVRVPKAVRQRQETWQAFGQAAIDDQQGVQTTVQSKEDVWLEDPHADTDLQEEDPAAAIAGNISAFWAKQQRRQLERKYDVGPSDEPEGAKSGGGWTQVGASASTGGTGAATGRYVPPSQRDGRAATAAPAARTDDLNTIRVTNLSENTTEADLQELFHRFGRISRVYLAKNKETMQSRGFAFVTFVNQKDAARAMEALQGYGYDHLILKLEWAKPSTPKDPGSSGTEFRSGYGKALAQDTKEKVSYASNLTK